MIGSTRAARRAGSQDAIAPTVANTRHTSASVGGSSGAMPNRRPRIVRVRNSAPRMPAARPGQDQ